MKRLLFVLAAAMAAVLSLGCLQARAGVNARVSIDADAGETAGLSSSPTVILQNLNDDGSAGLAAAGYGWPAAFPGLTGFTCAESGCADKSAGATASVDERAGALRAGAGASLLVGNAPDFDYGGLAFVRSESSVDDTLTLSKDATVIVEGTVHGALSGSNGDPNQLLDPTVGTDVTVGFCCRRLGEATGLIGGYRNSFVPVASDGISTPVDETFSIPVDLPAGDTEFQADLAQDVHMNIDGVPGMVLAENGLADFTGTVTFRIVVPGDVVATSASGLLPIVGGAQPAPSNTMAPVSPATVDPAPDAAGWANGPVTVHVGASDEDGGSGVASITVASSGAENRAPNSTDGPSVDVPVSTEGTTSFTYYATDQAGNEEQPHTLVVRIDRTAPTVTYDGNAGAYSVDQQVTIACRATDALAGIASSTCEDVAGPAYSFALGTNAFGASATDNAGNTSTAQTSFVVVADAASIAALTTRFVTESATFQALPPQRQAVVRQIAAIATRAATRIVAHLHPAQRIAFVRIYDTALAHLVRAGWLTQDQAATLSRLAATL
jgi:hypothetical protein